MENKPQYFENEHTNKLIFAIVTDNIAHKNDTFKFSTIQTFCEEVAMYCKKLGIFFYVFSFQIPKEHTIFGYIYESGVWIKDNVPLPDVVHNRIHSRKKEKSEEFRQFNHFLKALKIPSFNDHFINKWESFCILNEELQISPFLPKTQLLNSKSELEAFLHKFNQVFIKPIHGSQGKRLFRVTTTDTNYYLDYTTFSNDIAHCFSSFPLLFQAIRSRITKEAFIIQQAIPFIQYRQNEVDFRVLCNRNQLGNWAVTSIIARVSNKESFVANIARGGEIQKPINVLYESFDHTTTMHIMKLLKELAIEICIILSEAIEGYFGEFGIDLGIDKQGHPWIIEINTKPSKNFDATTTTSAVKIRPSAKAVVDYAQYLKSKNS